MSKQNQIIAAAIIAIIIAAGVAFFVITHRTKPQAQTPTPAGQEATSGASTETSGSIKSLLAMGKNVNCEISYTTSENKTSGTMFVSGKKMRGDFNITLAGGKQMDSHMIQDDTYLYSWSSAAAQGTKIKLEAINVSPAPGAQKQAFDMNQNVNYKCSDWNVDSSKFTPPATVQFLDVSQMMKVPATTQSTTGSTGGSSTSSYCNQLTDPQAKAACLSAYGSK